MSAVELSASRTGPAGAPPLLLGGSLGTARAMWQPQLSALAGALDVISFDHRGHGASPVPPGSYEMADLGRDVLALMDRLGLERAAYCGLSIGGMVGQWLAANAPERIGALVLICTAAYVPTGELYRERAAAVRAVGSTEVVADAVVQRWFTPEFAVAQPELVARHREMIALTPPAGYAGCCEAIAAMDLRDALSAVTAPTLVIAGERDPALPPELGRVIAQAIPRARLELVDAAHLASVEQAAEVSRLIAEHVNAPREA